MGSILEYSLKTALLFSVFYGFFWLFLRKDTHFGLNRFYLIGVMAAAVLLPLVRLENPFRVVSVGSAGSSMPFPYLPMVKTFGWSDWVLGLYLAGIAFYLFRIIGQLVKVLRLAANGKRRTSGGVTVILTDTFGAPFSFFHTVFVNRSNLRPHELDRIVAHEKVHAGQWHTVDCLLAELFTAFQWYNPLVWPYKRSLKETHEYLADHAVLAQGCEMAGYQMLILEQVVGRKWFEMTNHFRHSQIARRITMMKKDQSGRLSMAKILFSIPLVFAVMLIFARPKYVTMSEATSYPSYASEWIDQGFLLDDPMTQDPKAQDQKAQDQKEKELKAQEIQTKEMKEKEMKEHELQKDLEAKPQMTADDLRKKIAYIKDEYYKLTYDKDAGEQFSKKIEAVKKEMEVAKTDEEKQKWSETLKALEMKQQDLKTGSAKTIEAYKEKIATMEAKLKEMEQAEKSGQAKS